MNFHLFFKHHPALLCSLFFLLGLGFVKNYNPSFLIPMLAISLLLSLKSKRLLISCLVFFSLSCLYGHFKKESFISLQAPIEGTALFIPSEIKTHRSHFKKMKLLKGKVLRMDGSQGEIIHNIPCSILLSAAQIYPKINSSYYIQGSLEKKGESSFFYSLKPSLKAPWIPVPYSFSLAQARFEAKEFFSEKISSFFSNPKVANLMIALTLGNLDDRMLKFDFAKLGLQHVLSISGFHFGLLACISGLFFRLFFKGKTAYVLLFFFLTLYFILLGSSPSILRAYLCASLFLLSKLGDFRAKGLNLLGVALLLELLIDPHVISHLGFQLSFLATFSILFLLPLTRKWTAAFFPHRDINQITAFHKFERWGYLLCCFLRSAFALNLAVSLSIVPVCLFYFQKFPLISLAYNLFIPILLSLSLFLFFISVPLFLLFPQIASILNLCNEKFTERVLNLTSQSPLYFDLYLRVPRFSLLTLFFLLLTVFAIPFIPFSLIWNGINKNKQSTQG